MYLRTVFELNQRYRLTRFVVVVPSVAIKEGENKTLQITREHVERLHPTAKGYEFFQYDSDKLGQVRNFATSPNIQIMVITVGAINKFGDEAAAQAEESGEAPRRERFKSKMYRISEKTGGERPIDNQPHPSCRRAAECGRRHQRQRQEGAHAHGAHVPPALLGEPSTL